MKDLDDIRAILSAHKEELKKKYGLKEIGIFGSYVRNEQNVASDADILVEFEEVPDLLEFINLERYLEKLLQIRVDLVRKQAVREKLRAQILKEVIMA